MKTHIFKYLKSRYKDWDITIAMRYLPVVELIEKNYPPSVRILEIGPGELGILPYLDPKYAITGLDIDFGHAGQNKRMHMVKYSGTRLPFPDDSFDLVISMDTLEHVPPGSRESLISESLRVSKSWTIFGFPTGKFAKLADKFLTKYYRFTHGEDFPYLSEHIRYGLPDTNLVKQQFLSGAKLQKKNISLSASGNTNVVIWIGLLTLGFSEFKPFTFLFRLLNTCIFIFRYLNFPPVYRQIIFVNLTDGKN